MNQATAVSIRRMMHLMAPVGTNPISPATYRQVAQVRALFGQLCAAVTHPAPAQVMHCPADFGTEYVGTFYDGSRVLATFTYASSGCERVTVTAAGKTLATMVYGRAAAAAPHLSADLDVIVGAPKPGVMQPQAESTRAARTTPPSGQGRLPDSSRSNSPSLTPSTNASHSASVKYSLSPSGWAASYITYSLASLALCGAADVSVVTYTSTRLSSASGADASSPGVCMRSGYY